jgi:hypothetical protein
LLQLALLDGSKGGSVAALIQSPGVLRGFGNGFGNVGTLGELWGVQSGSMRGFDLASLVVDDIIRGSLDLGFST